MEFKDKCPGKRLIELVAAFNHIFYPCKMISREEFRRKMDVNDCNEAEESKLDRSYGRYEKNYNKRRQLADALISSGKHQETFEKLRKHVNSCTNCLPKYTGILEGAVEWEIMFGEYKGKVPKAIEIGQDRLEAYFLGLIKKEDSKLLRLLE